MKVKVLEHKCKRLGLLQHQARVQVEDYNGDAEDLVYETSVYSGYHPMGYGLYGSSTVTQLAENEFNVTWSTGTHCD